ncbi:hypothetical protein SDC9_193653 [bioreactor metagenome]|uniref:Peptidase S74 domain-containing protein n=1 Tax=bioreactor metagenome TaxID=1076179 RepID=A0A645IFC5_9ZZZZ
MASYTDSNADVLRFRTSGGNSYFDAGVSGQVRLGSATNYWNVVYATGGVNTGSDRTLKENIVYLDDSNMYDFYNFIKNDYVLAKYNYIGDIKEKISAIAQDILVNKDGSNNILGQLIVDCEEAFENKGKLSMNQTQLINIIIGAMQQMMRKIENLEDKINGN